MKESFPGTTVNETPRTPDPSVTIENIVSTLPSPKNSEQAGVLVSLLASAAAKAFKAESSNE